MLRERSDQDYLYNLAPLTSTTIADLVRERAPPIGPYSLLPLGKGKIQAADGGISHH